MRLRTRLAIRRISLQARMMLRAFGDRQSYQEQQLYTSDRRCLAVLSQPKSSQQHRHQKRWVDLERRHRPRRSRCSSRQ